MNISYYLQGYNFQKQAATPLQSALIGASIGAPLGGALGYFTAEEEESPWKKALYYGLMGGGAGGVGGYFVPGLFEKLYRYKAEKETGLRGEKLDEIQMRLRQTQKSMAKKLKGIKGKGNIEKFKKGIPTTEKEQLAYDKSVVKSLKDLQKSIESEKFGFLPAVSHAITGKYPNLRRMFQMTESQINDFVASSTPSEIDKFKTNVVREASESQ